MKKLWLGTVLVGVIALSAACSNSMQGHDMSNMHTKKETTSNKENLPLANDTEALSGKEIHLTAKETLLQLNDQVKLPVYTYNGSVPGAQIRVKQGERVKIVLKMNCLNRPPFIGTAILSLMIRMVYLG